MSRAFGAAWQVSINFRYRGRPTALLPPNLGTSWEEEASPPPEPDEQPLDEPLWRPVDPCDLKSAAAFLFLSLLLGGVEFVEFASERRCHIVLLRLRRCHSLKKEKYLLFRHDSCDKEGRLLVE